MPPLDEAVAAAETCPSRTTKVCEAPRVAPGRMEDACGSRSRLEEAAPAGAGGRALPLQALATGSGERNQEHDAQGTSEVAQAAASVNEESNLLQGEDGSNSGEDCCLDAEHREKASFSGQSSGVSDPGDCQVENSMLFAKEDSSVVQASQGLLVWDEMPAAERQQLEGAGRHDDAPRAKSDDGARVEMEEDVDAPEAEQEDVQDDPDTGVDCKHQDNTLSLETPCDMFFQVAPESDASFDDERAPSDELPVEVPASLRSVSIGSQFSLEGSETDGRRESIGSGEPCKPESIVGFGNNSFWDDDELPDDLPDLDGSDESDDGKLSGGLDKLEAPKV